MIWWEEWEFDLLEFLVDILLSLNQKLDHLLQKRQSNPEATAQYPIPYLRSIR